jgi:glycyl-tRNA synthetase
MISIEELSVFAKKKGFVFPSSEIYGGMSGFFDYGPLGVELKNNLRNHWWKTFVQDRNDVHGIDGSIISGQKIWKASGHVDNFEDVLVEDTVTQERYRADQLIEDALKISVDGVSREDLGKLIKDNNIKSPKGNLLSEPKTFNLMFRTNVGPLQSEKSTAYLRPETAQNIFVAFKNVVDSSRVKLPFGIAQIGKAFRNEIAPRDFLFRAREFEQMEIEYFTNPSEKKYPLLGKRQLELEFLFFSEEDQNVKGTHKKTKMTELLNKKLLNEYHAYWLAESYLWFKELGVNADKLRIRQHLSKELSHYSSATFDVEYKFPFGWKEIHGNANRGQFDLGQHIKHSGKPLDIFDEETKQRILPAVIEPSFGVDRAFLTFMYDAYSDDKERGNVVLKLSAKLAPVKLGVFPLVNKLDEKAKEVYELIRKDFVTMYDRSGSVGRRYARADEIGIPLCITVDFDSLEDQAVTVRDRDTTKQVRVKIDDLKEELRKLLEAEA